MRRALSAFLAPVVLVVLALGSGCGAPCDANHICNITHDAPDQLCDGSTYKVCGAETRNLTVNCGQARQAVCTPSGWTFQNTN